MSGSALASFYPFVSTLGEYMDSLVDGGQCLKEDDSAVFQRFLKTALVGHSGIRNRIAFYEPLEKLSDTVLVVIRLLLKRESSSGSTGSMGRPVRNILAQGYEMRSEGTMHSVNGNSGIANHYLNSSVVELSKPRWTLLLERAGTAAMAHLLQHTSVFLSLRNANYNQICGLPITSLSMPPPDPLSVPAIVSIFESTTATPKAPKESERAKTGKASAISALQGCQQMLLSAGPQKQGAKRQGGLSQDGSPARKRQRTGSDLVLSLASITIDRGKMLYSTPRTSKGKVAWLLSSKFTLNAHETADSLARQVFSRTPNFARHPPESVIRLVSRMLKLHKKFNYQFHLFKRCPAAWQKDSHSPVLPNTRPENLFDSDSEADDSAYSPLMPISTQTPQCSSALGESCSDPQSSAPLSTLPASPSKQELRRNAGAAHAANSAAGAAVSQAAAMDTPSKEAPSFLKMACTQHEVYMFLQTCVRSVIPRELVGGKHNHRRLYNLLKTLVQAGRFETMSLHEAVQRFRLSEAGSWLPSACHGRMDIYAGLIHWVLSDYAMCLIRSYFYVTESSNSRNELFFFRSDVWVNITRQAWESLESGMYTKKSLAEAADESSRSVFGFSRIRLLPKERGFRTITNLKKSAVIKRKVLTKPGGKRTEGFAERQVASTNKRLADSLAALTCVRKADPELMGSSTFGIDDVYTKLKRYKESELIQPLLGKSKLYIAKVDIRRAYDTIEQAKLLDLLAKRLPSDEYMVYKYWTLSPSFGKYRSSYLRHSRRSSDPVSFNELASTLSRKTKQTVYGDQSATEYIHMDSIYSMAKEHITKNTVKAKTGLLQQQVGIPQGSVLSSFLCNFFYGQLEREHLGSVVDGSKTLLMRMVDDFLLVSSERSQVVAFLERMHRGVPEYGCELNRAKTLANFDVAVDGQTVDQTATPGFPWCGLLIDDSTLDISVDYNRLARTGLGMAVTINTKRSAGAVLRQKMLASARTRMYPLYMDCNFNARQTVVLNLYQHFVVCAMKFHTMYQRLPVRSRNTGYLVKVAWDTILLAYVLLRSKCGDNNIPPADVAWVGLCAFCTVLRRKQSRYTQLLARLASAMSLPKFARFPGRYDAVINSPLNESVFAIKY